jgi:hypothetical protein
MYNNAFGPFWWENDYLLQYVGSETKSLLKSNNEQAGDYSDVCPVLSTFFVPQLLNLANLKIYKWSPQYSAKLERCLYGNEDSKAKIPDILKSQCTLSFDIWEKYFEPYNELNEFTKEYSNFRKIRNHIAHNKLVPLSKYTSFNENLNSLLQKIKRGHSSLLYDLSNTDKYGEYPNLLDNFESIGDEFNSAKKDKKSIIDEIIEVLDSLDIDFEFIERDDLEITQHFENVGDVLKKEEYLFLTVENLVKNNKRIDFVASFKDINDDSGIESKVQVLVGKDIIGELFYINGQTDVFDGIPMPQVINEIIGTEKLVKKICNYIEETFLPD